jgi:hypothetical protein
LKDSLIVFIGVDFMMLDFNQKEWTIGNLTNNLEIAENSSVINISKYCKHSILLVTGGIL